MIYFKGISLESVAPVKIEDIHVSPIQLSVIARDRPIRPGSQFVRVKGGTRTVAITFALLTNDRDTRQRQLLQINQWAQSHENEKLTLPYHDGKHLNCVCTSFPEPSLRQWWESKLRIVFTCFDNPYWTADAEKSAACGTAFFVGGDAEPLMRIERTIAADASDQTYSDGQNSMTFSLIPEGDMVIDLNRQTAAVDGQSIMEYYTFGSQFPAVKSGTQTITGTGTVKWRERWA